MSFVIDYLLIPMYLMLPAYVANMAPVVFSKTLKFMAIPVDGGIKFQNKDIFGKNKTVRGLVLGTLAGLLIAYFQFILQKNDILTSITILNYSNFLSIGFLLGFGALLGDLIESFFKRRLNIAPGEKFIPFDQLDFVLGSLLLLSIHYVPSLEIIIAIILVSFFGHIIINRLGYILKIKKNKW
ncbi:CDP-2,3-bis-(O-geranylgeranyl)-sn-glycerol synthase [Nanoarchaeota archaeon]